MKTFVLHSKQCALFQTFKTFEDVINRITEINKSFYDGDKFGLFGASYDFETGKNDAYFIDSAVLTRKENFREVYHTYFIHAIDLTTGEKTELI